jgi:hypothetical protein
VTGGAQVFLQVSAELQPGVIGGHMDSHTRILGRLGCARR